MASGELLDVDAVEHDHGESPAGACVLGPSAGGLQGARSDSRSGSLPVRHSRSGLVGEDGGGLVEHLAGHRVVGERPVGACVVGPPRIDGPLVSIPATQRSFPVSRSCAEALCPGTMRRVLRRPCRHPPRCREVNGCLSQRAARLKAAVAPAASPRRAMEGPLARLVGRPGERSEAL